MELNKKQREAVAKCLEWYYKKSFHHPLFILAGYAGTGKSSTISFMIDMIGIDHGNVLFATLTGKAATVLRMKGLNANTVHRSFYNCRPYKDRLIISKKKRLESNISLIVLDEFSMIPDDMIYDILSFGIPVIATGDPGQLPPLFINNSYLTEGKADVVLTEIMRTDDESGIIEIATMVRKGIIPKVGEYGRSRVLDDRSKLRDLSSYDKVLCWTHKTRRCLNLIIRDELGIRSRYPVEKDVINFLHNDYDHKIEYLGIPINVINGLECVVLRDTRMIKGGLQTVCRPKFVKSNVRFKVNSNKLIYDGYYEKVPELKYMIVDDKKEGRKRVYTDFGYCITVHSSQGSEYPNVLVLAEMPSHRPEYKEWLYTAVTRASNSVDILI